MFELIRGPVDAVPRNESFDVALTGGETASKPPASGPDARAVPAAGADGGAASDLANVYAEGGSSSLSVFLSLEHGQFDILPGQPGQPIRVEAHYDAASYSLEHELVGSPAQPRRLELRFGPTVSIVRRLLSPDTFKLQNRIKVFLPPDVPLDLTIRVGKGQHDIDLSGLTLTRCDVRAAQGQANLVFHEPNRASLESFEIRSKQGQLKARGLGHANARVLRFRGSAGNSVLDFSGEARGPTRAEVRMSMGSVQVVLPRDRRVQIGESRAFLGKVRTPDLIRAGRPGELEDTLTLDLSVMFGDIDVR